RRYWQRLWFMGSNSVFNFFISSLQRMTKLPSTLFMQVDGSRCNKNRVFFLFMAYLIERGLFTKVTIMFLP
ncbi:hypothetical protein PMAYCL1PPCAC_09401, partial [Pristionchus mayeri]